VLFRSRQPLAPKEIDPFIVDAERTLRRLQGALGEILDALPGRPARPQHIVELLKIDQKLAWRVANTIQSSDPFAAAQYVPGLAAFKKFLAVAAKAGATETLTNNAKDAFTDYERLTRTHAGDRASLEMMLTACAQEDQTTADLNHRRMAFRGLSYVWGAQAKTQLKTAIIAPSTDPGLIDFAIVHGFYQLRKLRPNAPLPVMRRRFCDTNGKVATEISRELSASSSSDGEIHLIKEFCSEPLPAFRTVESPPEIRHSILTGTGIGNTAAVTFVEGDVIRSMGSRYRNDENPYGANHASVCIPTEKLIVDFLIHEDTYGPLRPKVSIYGNNLIVPPLGLEREHDVLDMRQTVTYLGKGPSVLHSPDVPRYPTMARHVFDKLGWEGERFDVYRCAIDYPVVPCSVVVWFPLPEAPGK